LPLLVLARYGHLPGLNTKALHAQSYGTIRQSTGSQHANKAASTALYFTTSGDKGGGQAWLCLPTTPISSDTGIAKPGTKALLAQSHGFDSTEHRLSTPIHCFLFFPSRH
jgi:hypothetical protein